MKIIYFKIKLFFIKRKLKKKDLIDPEGYIY